jgi:hypothetical protein
MIFHVPPFLVIEKFQSQYNGGGYACHGLPYGKEDQTLLINDEPRKALWNPKWSGFFS